jgi:hypothetical protein
MSPTQDLGITLVYALPGIKSPGQMLEGWQISSTINLQTGEPFNGQDGSDDFAGVGGGRGLFGGANEPWSLYGKGTNFNGIGKLAGAPCYGFAAFPFAGCGATIPQACITAANAEPVNAAMNALSAGSSSGFTSLMATGCYMSADGKSVIIPPAQGTFGNMRPGAIIGPAFHEWDLSLRKTWKIRERISVEGSVSAFNVINSRSYARGFTGNIVNLPFLFGVSSGQPSDGNPVNGTGGARQVLLGLKTSF